MSWRIAALLLGLALLGGCATTSVVREDPAPRLPAAAAALPQAGGDSHRVQPGDTLYGIAFRNQIDWRDLARLNRIPHPYTIHPGQLLRLTTAAPRTASGPAPIPRAEPPPARPAPAQIAAAPAVTAPAPVATAAPGDTSPVSAFRVGSWRWPTEGQVVARFVAGDRSRQGIAIAGRAGQPVLAAAPGTVVYSGAGLVGFGELIILKHDDDWLSAYGHNRRRLVAEGARVEAGQPIAELGRTGTSRDMLHFEIRYNGRPVDPLPLLPSR